MNRLILSILTLAVFCLPAMSDSHGKFVIKGSVDPEMKAKAVFITEKDADGLDKTPRYVEIKADKFTYETELDDIKPGSIQVLLPEGEMAKSVVYIDFVPDFTLYISIYDGYYRLTNGKDYLSHTEEYCRMYHKNPENGKPYTPIVLKDNSSLKNDEHLSFKESGMRPDNENTRMSEILKSNISTYIKDKYVEVEVERDILKMKLDQYKELLNLLDKRMKITDSEKEYNALIDQQTDILKKMQTLIDKYASYDQE